MQIIIQLLFALCYFLDQQSVWSCLETGGTKWCPWNSRQHKSRKAAVGRALQASQIPGIAQRREHKQDNTQVDEAVG